MRTHAHARGEHCTCGATVVCRCAGALSDAPPWANPKAPAHLHSAALNGLSVASVPVLHLARCCVHSRLPLPRRVCRVVFLLVVGRVVTGRGGACAHKAHGRQPRVPLSSPCRLPAVRAGLTAAGPGMSLSLSCGLARARARRCRAGVCVAWLAPRHTGQGTRARAARFTHERSLSLFKLAQGNQWRGGSNKH